MYSTYMDRVAVRCLMCAVCVESGVETLGFGLAWLGCLRAAEVLHRGGVVLAFVPHAFD